MPASVLSKLTRVNRLVRNSALVLVNGIPLKLHNPRPKWAFIFFTRKCNLDCPYCNVQQNKNADDIPIDKWTRIIDRLFNYGVLAVNITGGEPLIRPEIFQLIQSIRKKRMLPFMHSNFSNINRESIDNLADSGLLALYASADGLNGFGKEYSQMVGDNLNYALQKGIIPIVSCVVTAKNIEQVPSFAEYITSRDILFCPGLYQAIGGAYSRFEQSLIPNSRQLGQFSTEMIKLKKRTGRITISYSFFENIAKYPRSWKCSEDSDLWVTIDNDGTLMPCQEYHTGIRVTDIDNLSDPKWRLAKKEIVSHCQGCFHHCYFQQDILRTMRSLREYKTALYVLEHLNMRRRISV